MLILYLIFIIIVCGVLLSDSIVLIPAYHFGVVERFGNRTGRIFREGLGFKLPFIDKVQLISMELTETDVSVVFTTKDKLQLTCSGSLQYRSYPEIKDKEGRNVFISMSEKIITSGIRDAIKAKLGALGGVKNGEDFIENRHAVADIINCFFRFKKLPHRDHDPQDCGVKNCDIPAGDILAENLLEFYKKHWVVVKAELDKEKEELTGSVIEQRYGIDIEFYALSDISFSEETQKAFEKEKQAEARQRAFKMKISMAKEVKDLGASPQVAFNAADVSLNPEIKKKVISVEGEAGILGGVLSGIKGGD
ncbi:MAG: SPFH domain-containing protein [Candidatus Paceibacterota bacterium]